MTSQLEKLLADLERLEKEATPGPWACYNGMQGFGLIEGISDMHEVDVVVDDGTYDNRFYGVQKKLDGELITNLRNNAPLLVNALRECIGTLAIIKEGVPIATEFDTQRWLKQFSFEARACLDKISKMGER